MLLFFEFVKPLVFTRSPVPVSFACVGAEQSYCSFEKDYFFPLDDDGWEVRLPYHQGQEESKVRPRSDAQSFGTGRLCGLHADGVSSLFCLFCMSSSGSVTVCTSCGVCGFREGSTDSCFGQNTW